MKDRIQMNINRDQRLRLCRFETIFTQNQSEVIESVLEIDHSRIHHGLPFQKGVQQILGILVHLIIGYHWLICNDNKSAEKQSLIIIFLLMLINFHASERYKGLDKKGIISLMILFRRDSDVPALTASCNNS